MSAIRAARSFAGARESAMNTATLTQRPSGARSRPRRWRQQAMPPSKDLLQSIGGPSENRAFAFLDDRPLNEIRVRDHQIDDRIIRQLTLAELQRLVDPLGGAKKSARLDVHFSQEIDQL